MAADSDDAENREEGHVIIDYDPPPVPNGVSADTEYLGRVYASGTRAILRDAHRRHGELKEVLRRREERGMGSWLGRQLNRLHPTVQVGLVLVAAQLVVQLSGAVYERLVGRPPPQVTVPTVVTQPIPTASASSDVGSALGPH